MFTHSSTRLITFISNRLCINQLNSDFNTGAHAYNGANAAVGIAIAPLVYIPVELKSKDIHVDKIVIKFRALQLEYAVNSPAYQKSFEIG